VPFINIGVVLFLILLLSRIKKYMLKYAIFFIIISNVAYASDWDKIRFQNLAPGKTYPISIGSGFFVNQDNIVTNKHVVEHCLNIAVRGAVKPTLVSV
jgi:S1-C subfamily serine protease